MCYITFCLQKELCIHLGWNGEVNGQTIHLTENLISINLLQMSCVIKQAKKIQPTTSKSLEIRKTFIFQICQQPRRLDVESLKNESFPNKALYSSFRSMEATDFKGAIQIKIQWAASEAAEVQRLFSRSLRPKFQNHLVFITFHNRIFVVLSFEVV